MRGRDASDLIVSSQIFGNDGLRDRQSASVENLRTKSRPPGMQSFSLHLPLSSGSRRGRCCFVGYLSGIFWPGRRMRGWGVIPVWLTFSDKINSKMKLRNFCNCGNNFSIVFHFPKFFAPFRRNFIKVEQKFCKISWTIWRFEGTTEDNNHYQKTI